MSSSQYESLSIPLQGLNILKEKDTAAYDASPEKAVPEDLYFPRVYKPTGKWKILIF